LRAIAFSPPAVFSIRIGSGKPPASSDRGIVLGGDVSAVHDEPLGADTGGRVGVLLHDLAAGDSDLVVGAGDVDQIRRMHVDREVGGAQRIGVRVRRRFLPALRVAEEELDCLGAAGLRCGQRVIGVDVCT
jgi:hypothetical protein